MILKHWKRIRKTKNLGPLQYLVIFPNENQHRFRYQEEAATVIQPADSRVTDFIRKQIREGCCVPKDIQSRTEYFVKETIFNGQKTKESKRRTFVPSRKKKLEIFFQSGTRQGIPKLIWKISPIWKINGWIMATFYLSDLKNILWWRRMRFQVNKPILTYFFTYLFTTNINTAWSHKYVIVVRLVTHFCHVPSFCSPWKDE